MPPRRPSYSTFRRRAQRGFVHLLLLVLAVLGLTMWGASELQHYAKDREQAIEYSSEENLSQAKQALLNYALLPPERIESDNIPGRYNVYVDDPTRPAATQVPFRYFSLPCPDVAVVGPTNPSNPTPPAGDENLDGISDILQRPCADPYISDPLESGSRFGRLPWREVKNLNAFNQFTYIRGLGDVDYRDGYGNRLWYAVSHNLVDNNARPLNPAALLRLTDGWLTAVESIETAGVTALVTLSDRVAAFVISPGQYGNEDATQRRSEEDLFAAATPVNNANIIESYLSPETYGDFHINGRITIRNRDEPWADRIEFITIDELVGEGSIGNDILENAPENIYAVLAGEGDFVGPRELLTEHLNRFGYLPEPAMFNESLATQYDRSSGPSAGELRRITITYGVDQVFYQEFDFTTINVTSTVDLRIRRDDGDRAEPPDLLTNPLYDHVDVAPASCHRNTSNFLCLYRAFDDGGAQVGQLQFVGQGAAEGILTGGGRRVDRTIVTNTIDVIAPGYTVTTVIQIEDGAQINSTLRVSVALPLTDLPPVYVAGGARVVVYEDGETMSAPFADSLARLDTQLNRTGLSPGRVTVLSDGLHLPSRTRNAPQRPGDGNIGGFAGRLFERDPNYLDQPNPITIDPNAEIQFAAGQNIELILSDGAYGYFINDTLVDLVSFNSGNDLEVAELPPYAAKVYLPPGWRISVPSDGMVARVPSNFSLPRGSYFDPVSGEWSLGGGTEVPIQIISSDLGFVFVNITPLGSPVAVGDMGLLPVQTVAVIQDDEGVNVNLAPAHNAVSRLATDMGMRIGNGELIVVPYPPPGRPVSNLSPQPLTTPYQLPPFSRFTAPAGSRIIYPAGGDFETGDGFVIPNGAFFQLFPGAVLDVELFTDGVLPGGGGADRAQLLTFNGADVRRITLVHGGFIQVEADVWPDPESSELIDTAQKTFDVEMRGPGGSVGGAGVSQNAVIRPFINSRHSFPPVTRFESVTLASSSQLRASFLTRARHHRIPMPQLNPGFTVPEQDQLLSSPYNRGVPMRNLFGLSEDGRYQVLADAQGRPNPIVTLFFDEDTQFLIPAYRPVSVSLAVLNDGVREITVATEIALPPNTGIFDADSVPPLSELTIHSSGGGGIPRGIVMARQLIITLAEVVTHHYDITHISVSVSVFVTGPAIPNITTSTTLTITTAVPYPRIMENRLALFPERDLFMFAEGTVSILQAGGIFDLVDAVAYSPVGLQRYPRVAEDLAVRSNGPAQLFFDEPATLVANLPALEKSIVAGEYVLTETPSSHARLRYAEYDDYIGAAGTPPVEGVFNAVSLSMPANTFVYHPPGVDLKFVSDHVGDRSSADPAMTDYERFGEGAIAVIPDETELEVIHHHFTFSAAVSMINGVPVVQTITTFVVTQSIEVQTGVATVTLYDTNGIATATMTRAIINTVINGHNVTTTTTLTYNVPVTTMTMTSTVNGPAYFSLNDGRGGAAAIVNGTRFLRGNPFYILSQDSYLHEADTDEESLGLILGQIPGVARIDIRGNIEQRTDSGFYADLLPSDSAQFLEDFPLIYAVAPECRRTIRVPGPDCAEDINQGLEFSLEQGEEYTLREPLELQSAAHIQSAYPDVDLVVWRARIGEEFGPTPDHDDVEHITIDDRTGMVELHGVTHTPRPNNKYLVSVSGNRRQTELRVYMYANSVVYDPDNVEDEIYTYAAVDGYLTLYSGGYARSRESAEGGATLFAADTVEYGYGGKMLGVRAGEKFFGENSYGQVIFENGPGATYTASINLSQYSYSGGNRGDLIASVSLSADAYNVDIYGGRYTDATVGQGIRVESGAAARNIALEGGRQSLVVRVSSGFRLPMESGYLWPGYIPQYSSFVVEQNPDMNQLNRFYERTIVDYYTRRSDGTFYDRNHLEEPYLGEYRIYHGTTARFTYDVDYMLTTAIEYFSATVTMRQTLTAGINLVTNTVTLNGGVTEEQIVTISLMTGITLTLEEGVPPVISLTMTERINESANNNFVERLGDLPLTRVTTGRFPNNRLHLRIQSPVSRLNGWGSGLERPETIDHISQTYIQSDENDDPYINYGASRSTRNLAQTYRYADWVRDAVVARGAVGNDFVPLYQKNDGFEADGVMLQEYGGTPSVPPYNRAYNPYPGLATESFGVLVEGVYPWETAGSSTRKRNRLTIAVAVRGADGVSRIEHAHWRPVVVEETKDVTIPGYVRVNSRSSSPLPDSHLLPQPTTGHWSNTIWGFCNDLTGSPEHGRYLATDRDPNNPKFCHATALLGLEWMGRFNRSGEPEDGYIDNFMCDGEPARAALNVPHTDLAGTGFKFGAWPSMLEAQARPNVAGAGSPIVVGAARDFAAFQPAARPAYAPLAARPANYGAAAAPITPQSTDPDPRISITYEPSYHRDFSATDKVTVTTHSDMVFYMDSAYYSNVDAAYSPVPQQTLVFGPDFRIHGPSALVPPFGGREEHITEAVYAERSNIIRQLLPDTPPLAPIYGENYGDCRAFDDCPAMLTNPHWFPITGGALTFDGLQVRFPPSGGATSPGNDGVQVLFPQPTGTVIDHLGSTVTIYAGSLLQPRLNRIEVARPLPPNGRYQLIPNDDNLIAVVDVSPARREINREVRSGDPEAFDAGIMNMAPSRATRESDGAQTDCIVEPLGFVRPGPMFNFDMRAVADRHQVSKIPRNRISYGGESETPSAAMLDSPLCQAFSVAEVGQARNDQTRCGYHPGSTTEGPGVNFDGQRRNRSKLGPYWYRYGLPWNHYRAGIGPHEKNYAYDFQFLCEDPSGCSGSDGSRFGNRLNYKGIERTFWRNIFGDEIGLNVRMRNWTNAPLRVDGSFNRGFLADDDGLALLTAYHSGVNIFADAPYQQAGRHVTFYPTFERSTVTTPPAYGPNTYGSFLPNPNPDVGPNPPSSNHDLPLRNPQSYQWLVPGTHFHQIGVTSITLDTGVDPNVSSDNRDHPQGDRPNMFDNRMAFISVGVEVTTDAAEFEALRLAHQINIPLSATVMVNGYNPTPDPGSAESYFTFPPGSEAFVLNVDAGSWASAHPYIALQKQGLTTYLRGPMTLTTTVGATLTLTSAAGTPSASTLTITIDPGYERTLFVTVATMVVGENNDGYRRIDLSGKHVVHYQRAEPSQHMEPLSSVPIRTNVWLRLPTGGLLYDQSTGHAINLSPNSLVNPIFGTYLNRSDPNSGVGPPLENQYLTEATIVEDFHINRAALTIPAGARLVIGDSGGIITNVKAAIFFSLTPLENIQCPTGQLNIATGMDGAPVEINQFREGIYEENYELDDLTRGVVRRFSFGHPCAWLDDPENMDGDRQFIYRGRRRYSDPLELRPTVNDRTYLLGGRVRIEI